ncbi:MAG: hypothetical protein H0U23_17915 [Blastocatellia bacterium]|nr:hypothetical protein [Blastocatellia bacterium]
MPVIGPALAFKPVIGGIMGGIRPPAGLSRTQGAARGFARGLPFYNLVNTINHAATGTLGQWGDPANNPINHPENFGGAANPYGPPAPAADPTVAAPAPAPVQPAQQPSPGQSWFTPTSQAGAWTNSQWNAWRSPGSQTFNQAMFPGSAIGPFGGGRVNPYNPNSTHGTPNGIDTSIPGWAAAFGSDIRRRNQP